MSRREATPWRSSPSSRYKIQIAIERRQAVDALRIENEKNRGLMDHANDAIFIADAETGMLIDANTKAQSLIGRFPGRDPCHEPERAAPEGRGGSL